MARPGLPIHTIELDVERADAIADFARRMLAEHPAINILINNAGIMRFETLDRSRDHAAEEDRPALPAKIMRLVSESGSSNSDA